MPGIFDVPGAGIKGASLDEVVAYAKAQSGGDPSIDDIAEHARPGAKRLLQRISSLASTSFPELLNVLDVSGEPILQTDLQVDAAEKIVSLLGDLPPPRVRRILRMAYDQIAAERKGAASERFNLDREMEKLRAIETAWLDMKSWLALPLTLGRAHGSMLHKVVDALRTDSLFVVGAQSGTMQEPEFLALWEERLTSAEVFIVEHDWAAAFANSTDYADGEIKMPADPCIFEFHISGRRVLALVIDTKVYLIVSTPTRWLMGDTPASLDGLDMNLREVIPESIPLERVVLSQIRAIAIALDAEAAVSDVVRAPHKMNHARERKGKVPLFSYHVVNLARRSRAPLLPEADGREPGTRRRLHFRRGHWRHFDTHKTWIKWMLVGNPDLGFVDKEYRL